METQTHTVVIGAGPGGYPAAIRLGQLGVKTLVIDYNPPGGVCLNWGCIPSKALIHAANVVDELRHAAEMGITLPEGAELKVDMGKLIDWKAGIVRKLNSGVAGLLKGNNVEWLEGRARFTGPRQLSVKTREGERTVRFERCVIATGARPVELPGLKFGDKVMNAWNILDLREVPKRLMVVGGGVIGLELGTVFQKLGSQVTIVEATDALLPGTDPELVRPVERRFKKAGAKILKETFAKGYEEGPDGLAVRLESKSGEKTTEVVDRILVGVGFRPNTEELGLDKAGVEVDQRGFIKVDDRLATNVSGIHAIGDVVGGMLLAHKATKEGEICAEIIAGHKRSMRDVLAIPAAVYTDPEIATVGLSEARAKEQHGADAIAVGSFSFGALGRAMSVQKTEGVAKIVTLRESGRILGAGIVGVSASDLIAELTLAIEMGATAEDVGLTVHAHPSLPEAVMEAANDSRGEAIHKISRKR